MSGFKQTLLEHDPVMMLSFDGDAFNPHTRLITQTPWMLMDESQHQNHGIFHIDSQDFPGYRMGMASLVDIEQAGQHSISFGHYGYTPGATHADGWPKAFIEVPHIQAMEFNDNDDHGSFCLVFMVNKMSNDSHYLQSTGKTVDLFTPMVRKAGVFSVRYADYWAGIANRIEVDLPIGNNSLTWTVPDWFYGTRNFIALNWRVVNVHTNVFKGTAELWVNSQIVDSKEFDYVDVVPTTTSSAPVEIGGTINPQVNHGDRAKTALMLDQVTLISKAMHPDDITRLVKKVKTYDGNLFATQPTYYWSMSDSESTIDSTMYEWRGNGLHGKYLGTLAQVVRSQPGPPQTLGNSAVYFNNGGCAVVRRTNAYNDAIPIITTSGDWSVEFWASFENQNRSVLLALQGVESPFPGILIEANVRANQTQTGHIQFSIRENEAVWTMQQNTDNSMVNLGDGHMHHIVAIRRGTYIELWVDGMRHGIALAEPTNLLTLDQGQLYLMGAGPGRLSTTGKMCSLAIHPRALQAHEIRMRRVHSQIYRIRGTVTLEGSPHQATVRAFNHNTGELVREVLSDINTGDYIIPLYDNSLIDLMALNKQDRNIRYRVYGPITPETYSDTP